MREIYENIINNFYYRRVCDDGSSIFIVGERYGVQ